MRLRNHIIDLIAGIYICAFFYTAITKWAEMPKFLGQMERMPFGDWAAAPVAYGLPTLMGVLALWFAFGKNRRLPFLFGMGLLGILGIYIVLILTYAFGPGYPCSCAGLLDLSWKQQLYGNIAFITLGIIAVIFLRHGDQGPMIAIKPLLNQIFNTKISGHTSRPDEIKGEYN